MFCFTLNLAVSAQSIIKEENNMVGIALGTASPTSTLDVGGSIVTRGGFCSTVSGVDIGGFLSLDNPAKTVAGTANRWTIYNMGGGYGNSLQFWAYDQQSCAGGLCAPRLVIMDNGNVGIGASAPEAKLSVNGGILATKIKVNQNLTWPDYVFEPTYQLPSLYQLEQFIRQNKHLPDVPSAETIAREGLDLGDTQAALLKKIEELTLYVIELKKEVDDLRKSVAAEKK